MSPRLTKPKEHCSQVSKPPALKELLTIGSLSGLSISSSEVTDEMAVGVAGLASDWFAFIWLWVLNEGLSENFYVSLRNSLIF